MALTVPILSHSHHHYQQQLYFQYLNLKAEKLYIVSRVTHSKQQSVLFVILLQ